MLVPESSLSLAINSVAAFLAKGFEDHYSKEVHVLIDTPSSASDKAKSSEKHYLNIFVYRIAPSGFHAATTANEPLFVRVNALITPFLGKHAETDDYAELRMIGHAVRVLQGNSVIPTMPLPGPLPGSGVLDGANYVKIPDDKLTEYRVQAVLLAPSMEELNHIWTTQNNELAYRLSAAYEFALIPIEPLAFDAPAPPARTAIYDVAVSMDGARKPPVPLGANTVELPLAGKTQSDPPPTNWLPVILFADGGNLTNTLTKAKDSTPLDIAIAGLPGADVHVEVEWVGSSPLKTTSNVYTIKSHRIDLPLAKEVLALTNPWPSATAIVRTRPAKAGLPIADSPFANTLTLTAAP